MGWRTVFAGLLLILLSGCIGGDTSGSLNHAPRAAAGICDQTGEDIVARDDDGNTLSQTHGVPFPVSLARADSDDTVVWIHGAGTSIGPEATVIMATPFPTPEGLHEAAEYAWIDADRRVVCGAILVEWFNVEPAGALDYEVRDGFVFISHTYTDPQDSDALTVRYFLGGQEIDGSIPYESGITVRAEVSDPFVTVHDEIVIE